MDSNKSAELAIFVICICILLLYNILYFTKFFKNLKFRWRNHRYRSLWGVGGEAKVVWASQMIKDVSHGGGGVTTAQTIRNMVMGVSILAAGVTLLASQLLVLLTEPVRLAQVAKYSSDDPISGDTPLMQPQTKLGIALGVLFLALLSMGQCVRLSVHLTYMIIAAAADPKRQRRFQKIAFAMNRRASLYFSIGLRLQYAFFPLFLYILGPLALLLSTCIEIAALFFMDLTPDDETLYGEVEDEKELEEHMDRELSMSLGQEIDGAGGVKQQRGEGLTAAGRARAGQDDV